ncbi:MAG: phosphoenolpyruvate--protein phosphotransferase [Actinomycetales bacterium]
MTVGLVVVSHSAPLAQAAIDLAKEMLGGRELSVLPAAGLEDGSVGTDAAAISAAVTAADTGDGVVVLMDLGSAVLSAEMALEFLDEADRKRVVLCPAPLVEGLVVAVTVAAGGADRATVAAEAARALESKTAQLPTPGDAQQPAGNAEDPDPDRDADDASADPDGEGGDDGSAERASFVVDLVHGLHARPVARLVGALAGIEAEVRLRNASTASRWVDARSVAGVAALGVRRGHEVQVRAQGAEAAAAVTAVLEEARVGFGEGGAPDREAGPSDRDAGPFELGSRAGSLTRVNYAVAVGAGSETLPLSPGFGIGPAHLDDAGPVHEPGDAPGRGDAVERDRLGAALDAAAEQLEAVRAATLAEVGAHEAEIFNAQLLMLRDPLLQQRAEASLAQGRTAERAWWEAAADLAGDLEALPDEYQRARAEDLRAVAGLVLAALRGGEQDTPAADASPGDEAGPHVLIATELPAARAATLRAGDVAAVVLTRGSATSHAAILLRSRAIPAVLTNDAVVAPVRELLHGGADAAAPLLAVDGSSGQLLVAPDERQLQDFRTCAAAEQQRRESAGARAAEAAVTADGVPVLVGANVGSAREATQARAGGADLAGLVRTEFLFLDRATPPSVEEQIRAYRELAAELRGRRLTLRTLDIGGDKPVPYVSMAAEDNPFLGIRGLRLSLTHPDLLRDQLTAIVTVAHETPVSVMFPMVASLAELDAARVALDAAVELVGRGRPAELQVGVMVEIPALALKTAAVAPALDFLSIGTNDLTQYALAADRGHEELAVLADPLDPGVLRLIDAVCRDAGTALVAVCGELAADADAVPLLLGLGVRELSVSPGALALTKQRVREVDVTAARELAQTALQQPSASEVRARVRAGLA